MKMRIFLALLLLQPLASRAASLLADTADLTRYASRSLPDGKLIHNVINADQFTRGAMYKGGLHLQESTAGSGHNTIYRAAALMADANGRLFYRKFDITVGAKVLGKRRAQSVEIVGDVDLAQLHFSASVGVLDRLVVLEDAANDITLAFPLGVGGIDEAVIAKTYRVLTPKFKNATLDRKSVQPNRTEPTYYRNRPFMPITTAGGEVTAIAFHITILSDEDAQQNGLNHLIRGFESHGCMRMREKDLMEFFSIVMNGGSEKIPVNVDDHVWGKNAQGVREVAAGEAGIEHPHPFNTSSYMRVTRFPDAPFYKRDEVEHLVIMDRAEGQPDFRRFPAPVTKVLDLLSEPESDLDLKFPLGFAAP